MRVLSGSKDRASMIRIDFSWGGANLYIVNLPGILKYGILKKYQEPVCKP